MASLPFLSEIQIFAFNFAPIGWAPCSGQLLPINQNQALFALLGTTYGGNGQTTFALPDLRGRVPLHIGNGFDQGQQSGSESHTLTTLEMPSHTHIAIASTAAANQSSPVGNTWASGAAASPFKNTNNAIMNAAAFGNTGGNQPHENRMPYLVMNYCIALEGIFPSRN